MNYSEYTAAALAADNFFMQWVKHPTAASNLFWENWLQRNPGKQETLQEARALVLLLSEDEDMLQDHEITEIWQKLTEARALDTAPFAATTRPVPLRFWQRTETRKAAALGLLLVAGFILFKITYTPAIVYATQYGEKQTIKLPDSAVVILNANSVLTVPASWPFSTAREVILTGEAYFTITPKANKQRFVVHTLNGVQVQVTGTAFNVSDRGNKSEVVLTSGRVQLNIVRAGQTTQLRMQPGELVEVPDKTKNITRRQVNTALYTSWKDNKLVFYNTPLSDIADRLLQEYGYTVVFEDTALADQKITAYLEAGSLNDILSTLSETVGVKITRNKQKMILISNN